MGDVFRRLVRRTLAQQFAELSGRPVRRSSKRSALAGPSACIAGCHGIGPPYNHLKHRRRGGSTSTSPGQRSCFALGPPPFRSLVHCPLTWMPGLHALGQHAAPRSSTGACFPVRRQRCRHELDISRKYRCVACVNTIVFGSRSFFGGQAGTTPALVAGRHHAVSGRRLAGGGATSQRSSARTSLRSRVRPSTLAVPAIGKKRGGWLRTPGLRRRRGAQTSGLPTQK